MSKIRVASVGLASVALLLVGCSQDTGSEPAEPSEQDSSVQRYPDITEVTVERSGESFTVSATVSSPYDSQQRYADAFRVRDRDGNVLGVRELTHPHTEEQPFTRSLSDVDLPEGLSIIEVQGRDLNNGWGGATATAEVPGR